MKNSTLVGWIITFAAAFMVAMGVISLAHRNIIRGMNIRLATAKGERSDAQRSRNDIVGERNICKMFWTMCESGSDQCRKERDNLEVQYVKILTAFKPLKGRLDRRCRNTDDQLSCEAVTALDTVNIEIGTVE